LLGWAGDLAQRVREADGEGAAGNQGISKTCSLIAVASARDPRLVSITITDYAALAEALAKGAASR